MSLFYMSMDHEALIYKYSELMIIPQEPVKENPTLDFWPYVATLQKV